MTQKERLMMLLRQTVMRNHMAMPENKQDERWFDEGWSMDKSPEYLKMIYETLELGNYKNNDNTASNPKTPPIRQEFDHPAILGQVQDIQTE